MIVGTGDGRLALFDLRKANHHSPVESYKALVGGIKEAKVHPTLPLVFSISNDRFVRVHQMTTKKLVHSVSYCQIFKRSYLNLYYFSSII